MSYENIELTEVLQFWFEELSEAEWFTGGAELDARIRERFRETHRAVAAGEFWRERAQPKSVLAEIIVLDQFSRQMFRGQAAAFAWDGMALTLAQQMVLAGHDAECTQDERLFMYLPFMHSESRAIHEEAVKLFESLGQEKSLEFEHIHKDIIDRFGRYPHRNEQLGRTSTPAEVEYLANNQEDFFAA